MGSYPLNDINFRIMVAITGTVLETSAESMLDLVCTALNVGLLSRRARWLLPR